MIDTTIEELMQENATLRAEVARLQSLPVWQPVGTGFVYRGGMSDNEGELEVDGDAISISAESGYVWGTTKLPDNIRLCRLVSQEA
jgi:hypothetical protein